MSRGVFHSISARNTRLAHDGEAVQHEPQPGLTLAAPADLSPDAVPRQAVVCFGPDHCVTAWNAGAQAMLGWTAAEALGRSCAFLLLPDDAARRGFEHALEAAAHAGQAEHKGWFVHCSGSLVWGEGHLAAAGPGLPGSVLTMRDGTAHRREIETLQAAIQNWRMLAEGIPQLVWRSCDQGRWTWVSPQWIAFTGLTQEESCGLGWLAAVHPEDRDAAMREWERAVEHGEVLVEFRLRRASDGAWRWHQTRSKPVRSPPEPSLPQGRIVEWLGTTTDIEDFKQLQGRQSLLVAELQHRTRNLLALVSAIARRNFGQSDGSIDFQLRLATLGRVQGFLSRNEDWELDLEELIRAELEAAGNGASPKARVEGPAVALPGDRAQSVALALHELATNAAKYGALAQPMAGLSVTWRVEGGSGAGRQLVLEWRETQVSMPPDAIRRRGYGTELIERALPYQLKARTELVLGADGVRCTLVLPLGPVMPAAGR